MTGFLVPHARPYARAGQVIGLLGGSFDPPHAGHLHISREALRRFALDGLWWMISPGNPLKAQGPAPMPERIAAAHRLIGHAPRIRVTDIEAQLGTRHTAQTLAHLRGLYPGVGFVWLMGADNLAQLHRWQDWRQIIEGVPVGVLARPGARQAALNSPAARIYRHARLPASAAWTLGHRAAPAWCFVNAPMVALSSTGLRARAEWPRG